MPVLKQHQTTPAMREAIVLDLGDIGAQAARIRAAAETRAQQIIADAEIKAKAMANQREAAADERGYQAGLERGLKEGREQGHAEALAQSAEQLRQLSAAWSQVVDEWEQQRTEMEREARQSVLNFALLAAEKLVHRVIEIDESVVVDQAAQALSLVLSAHNASVRIHPVDRPLLEDALPSLLQELSQIEHIDLLEDEAITPGGCVVTFGQGQIDATIEKQLGRLIDLILPGSERLPGYAESSAGMFDDDAALPSDAATPSQQPSDPNDLTPPVYEITDRGLVPSAGSKALDEPSSQSGKAQRQTNAEASAESTNDSISRVGDVSGANDQAGDSASHDADDARLDDPDSGSAGSSDREA